jgi:guanylate kinase
VVAGLLAREAHLWLSVSATTRPPRPGERDGAEYHFVSRDDFVAQRDAGGFLEAFEVYGDLYGTPRAPVEEHLASGHDVVLEIDVKGALAVRRSRPDALLVFVMPPSRDEQRRRLTGRRSDTAAEVERRLGEAEAEERKAAEFDAVVVNDDLGAAVDALATILQARRDA